MPCILESLKTTDQKTFYKTADISQMLICSNDMEPSDDESDSPKKKKEKGDFNLSRTTLMNNFDACNFWIQGLYFMLYSGSDRVLYCTCLELRC